MPKKNNNNKKPRKRRARLVNAHSVANKEVFGVRADVKGTYHKRVVAASTSVNVYALETHGERLHHHGYPLLINYLLKNLTRKEIEQILFDEYKRIKAQESSKNEGNNPESE